MIQVAAIYRFVRFPDPAALRGLLLDLCAAEGIKDTLLLAGEGINGTIAGPTGGIGRVVAHIRTLPNCADLEVKFSTADIMPFHRLKVRLKCEIVTLGEPVDPLTGVGTYVAPADWNALIDAPGTLVIDTRNDYEVRVGSFAGAVDPGTASFSDFPAWFREHRDEIAAAPRVAMFCTGGIRCEKATALLKAEGISEVHHLQGGILKYLEEVSEQESRWLGECFVFDERVAVGHGLAPGTHELCRGCRGPVSPAGRTSPPYQEGVSCPACHDSRDDRARAGYAERHRQTELAKARGQAHIGATPRKITL